MLNQVVSKRVIVPAIRRFSSGRVALIDQPTKTDAFGDREKAQENVYIKKHEQEQLKKLKEKLEQQKKSIESLEKEINDFKK